MKVKDILPKKKKMENELKDFQKLEKFLLNGRGLAERITDEAQLTTVVVKLITEARMKWAEEIAAIDHMIEEAEIQHEV